MPIQVHKPDSTKWLKMLFFGLFDSGKTRLMASAAEVKHLRDVFFIDAEAGTTSIADVYPDIDVVTITELSEFNEIYQFLLEHIELRDAYIAGDKGLKQSLLDLESQIHVPSDEPRLYRTVVMDSLSEVQKYVMASILGINAAEIEISADMPYAARREWGKNGEIVRTIVRKFRNLPMHVLMSAHAQTLTPEDGGEGQVVPLLPGKLPFEVMGLINVVGYLYQASEEEDYGLEIGEISEETTRKFRNILLTQSVGPYKARDRYNRLGRYTVSPTMQKLSDKLRKKP